jgi:predicted nucleic acid-binding protein
MNFKVKVYLDACALNRPFDDQSLPRNRLETEAVIVILDQIERGMVDMISSSALLYENLKSPLVYRREYVATYLDMASVLVTADEALRERAREITQQSIAPLDALHPASAERAETDWFLTCDDRMLRKARRGKLTVRVEVSTPVEFVAKRSLFDG